VRWGSGNRGGAGYQALAIVLTYVTIVTTYVPLVIKSVREANIKKAQAVAAASTPGPSTSRSTAPDAAAQPANPDASGSPSPAVTQEPAANAPSQAPEQISGAEIARALAMFGVLILALPFLQGFQNIIGIAIIAFALFEAWKLNRRIKIGINGPFTPGAVARA
jgi:hypothetical protein